METTETTPIKAGPSHCPTCRGMLTLTSAENVWLRHVLQTLMGTEPRHMARDIMRKLYDEGA